MFRRDGRTRLVAWATLAAAILLVGGAAQAGAEKSGGTRPAEQGRRARLQRLQPDPAIGQADDAVRRPLALRGRCGWRITSTTSGTTSRRCRFLSSRPGSGSNVTWVERLGKDPSALPTVSNPGSDVTHNFELTIAPWMSMELCDPNSDPQLPCTPRSDANAPHGSYPGGGSAFMELQFYPPGFAPFLDSISCDNTHWCSALTIDSVACTLRAPATTTASSPSTSPSSRPTASPPGRPARRVQHATVTPNSHTLLMNQGDKIVIHMLDAPAAGGHALEIVISDTDHRARAAG